MTASHIPYDRSATGLLHPGRATDFFPLGGNASDAGLCAEMARVAYVKFEEGGAARRSFESVYLPRVGFRLVGDPFTKGGTQGFVADGETRDGGPVRVVAFRGTEPDDWRDILTDVDFRETAWDGGWVHRGFARAFSRVSARVLAAIDDAGPARRVFVTGHSLGAALATLTASLRPGVLLFTFGSPRVGDTGFARLVGPRHARFVDHLDAVTRVPPAGALDYTHAGAGYFIEADGGVSGPLADDEIVRRQRLAGCAELSVADLFDRLRRGDVALRDLTDHAPINYSSAVLGIRSPGTSCGPQTPV